MNNLRVSIITVCYNSSQSIERAIQSVIMQSYKNIEYLIIDGYSSDETLDVINKYKDRITKVVSEKDDGIYDAMNKGIKIATGDIIYFLNSDDLLYDANVIIDIVGEFQNSHADLIYGRVRRVKVPDNILPYIRDHIIRDKYDLLDKNICHQAIFFKKKSFDEFGLFNVNYRVYADYDWLLSAFSKPIASKSIERHIAIYNYQGFSYKEGLRSIQEKADIIRAHFPFYIFAYYSMRYVLLRKIKTKLKSLRSL